MKEGDSSKGCPSTKNENLVVKEQRRPVGRLKDEYATRSEAFIGRIMRFRWRCLIVRGTIVHVEAEGKDNRSLVADAQQLPFRAFT